MDTEPQSHGSDGDWDGAESRCKSESVFGSQLGSGRCQFGGDEQHLQLVGAVARLVHAMALFEQLEELFDGNARVGRAPKGEDLPHQHPK